MGNTRKERVITVRPGQRVLIIGKKRRTTTTTTTTV